MPSLKRGLAWKLHIPGTLHDSYLLGSMHARSASAHAYRTDFERLIDRSDKLALEANIHEADSDWVQERLLLPDGGHLRDHLREQQYSKLRKMLRKIYKLDLDLYGRQWPLLLVQGTQQQASEEIYAETLDLALLQYAFTQGKEVSGIERFEEQFDLIARIPIDVQVDMLKHSAKRGSALRKQVKKMEKAYAAQDIRYLYQTAKRQLGPLRKWMLTQRNQVMAERIVEMIRETSWTLVIGAAHLAGKQGVLPLLKRAGVQLEPVALSSIPLKAS